MLVHHIGTLVFFYTLCCGQGTCSLLQRIGDNDDSDKAETSKCQGLKPLKEGWKVTSGVMSRQGQKNPTKEPKIIIARNFYQLTQTQYISYTKMSSSSKKSTLLLPTQSEANQRCHGYPARSYCHPSPERINGVMSNPARCYPRACSHAGLRREGTLTLKGQRG